MAFRNTTSKELARQEKVISDQTSEIAQLKRYLAATRERVAELEAKEKLSASASASSTPATPASALIAEEKDRWQRVRSNLRSRDKLSRPYATVVRSSPCLAHKNKFEALDLEEGEIATDSENLDVDRECQVEGSRSRSSSKPKAVIVIGDSNVRRLDGPIKRNLKSVDRSKVSIESYSGIGTDRLVDKVTAAVTKEESKDVKVIVHVGTNDVTKMGSQELLAKLGRLIRAAKDARTGISVEVCKVPSRTDKGNYIFSRSESVNCQLARLCRENGASCLDLGGYRLGVDGVHYNTLGATSVSSNIAKSIISFLG